jgi:opacity protein-like surface antigen
MKTRTALSALVAATLVTTSFAAVAQGQQQGGRGQQGGQQGGQQYQQQRQAERSATQERAQDRERVQTREQDRARVHQQDGTGTPAGQAKGAGNGIYGGNLMSVEERNQYRQQLGGLKTEQQRSQFQAQHREQMQLRAKEKGVAAEVTAE